MTMGFELYCRYPDRRTRKFHDILVKVATSGNAADGDLHMNMESGKANWSCHQLTVVIEDRAALSDSNFPLDSSELIAQFTSFLPLIFLS